MDDDKLDNELLQSAIEESIITHRKEYKDPIE